MSNGDKRPFFKKTDIIVIAFILVVCVVVAGIQYSNSNASADSYAEIYQDGRLIESAELSNDGEFSAGGAEFEIKNNMIRFKDSDCPDKLCVNFGFIGKAGDIAVCLPKKLYIKIIGQASDPNSADIIAG